MQKENNDFVRDNMYEGSKAAIYAKPIFYAVIAMALIGMGIYSFIDIQNQEANGVVILKGKTQAIYDLGGKWLVVGCIFLAAGVVSYRTLYFWKGIKKGIKK